MEVDSKTFNRNCLEAMRETADKHFDLAIVDPPYGLDKKLLGGNNGMMKNCFKEVISKEWDKRPPKEYFIELFRVSKNQIIWGGNYFIDYLYPTQCFLIWDKMNGTNNMADAELAWTSLQQSTRKFSMHHFSDGYDKKIHPTQKPAKLYRWILKNFAQIGDKILDTHLGSGSSRIAAYDLGFDFFGYELDSDYFEAQEKRFAEHIAQPKLFESLPESVEQNSLFQT